MVEPEESSGPGAPEPKAAEAPPVERRDADGLPVDRAPTLDDVRGGAGSGRSIAVGCTVVVLLLVIGFWLLRAGLLG